MLGGRADLGVNWAQIDIPAPLAHVVGVTDGIAELRPLAADITNSCHDLEVPSQADAETFILQEGAKNRQNSRDGGRPRPMAISEVWLAAHAALPSTGCEQCAHRRASIGISLRHSGHFFVVGSAGAGALRMRETSALTGVTTKK